APSKKPAVSRRAGFATRTRFIRRSSLDQRPPRGRPLGAAAPVGTARLRLALAGAGQLFRLRRDRSLGELEADLVLAFRARLVLDQHDADMAAALQMAEQHFISQRLLDVLLDHARHRTRPHLLVVT